jgi:hypothetical protein
VSDTFARMATGSSNESEDQDYRDEQFVADITPDVMRTLDERKFFEELDNRLCPAENSSSRERCDGTFKISSLLLRSQGFDESDLADILSVLQAQGWFCDCEVLYNVVETSRLRTEYWRARAADEEPPISHTPRRQ